MLTALSSPPAKFARRAPSGCSIALPTPENGRRHDEPIRLEHAHKRQADARQCHARRHKPWTGFPVVQPAEQRLDDGRSAIRGQHQHGTFSIRKARLDNQKRQYRRQAAPSDIDANMPSHQNEGQLVRKAFSAFTHEMQTLYGSCASVEKPMRAQFQMRPLSYSNLLGLHPLWLRPSCGTRGIEN